jgi:hypothetical protein
LNKLQKRLIFNARKFYYSSDFPKNDLKRHYLCYQIFLIASIAFIAFAIFDACIDNLYSSLIDIIGVTGILMAMYGYYKGFKSYSKVFAYIIVGLCIIINGSTQGRMAGNQYLWFPMVSSVLVFFSLSEKKQMLFCLLWSFICIVFMEITDYSYFKTHELSEEALKVNSIICLTLTIIVVFLNSYFMVISNGDVQKKLKKVNVALSKSNSELKKSNSELDSFVYKASHDLRSPLVSILGLIHISKEEKDFEKVKKYLLLKEKSVKKLDALIIDILDLSKNSRLAIIPEQIDLKFLFEDIFSSYSYVDGFHNIEKVVSIDAVIPFFSDEKRLRIIFNNLISNSIRYADLSKEKPRIEIITQVFPSHALITVRDNGQGIKSEHFKRIFEMYFRANERNAGSGLGLYIVSETLAKLKGNIEIASEYTKWTEFKVVIPNMKK